MKATRKSVIFIVKFGSGMKLCHDDLNARHIFTSMHVDWHASAIIAYLKQLAPKAKLIFATTTPVPEGEPGRIAGDAAKYNQIALKVLKDYPEIAVDDLYAFTKPQHAQWWTKPGNVHFNTAGATAQGKEVARVIEQQLKPKQD